MSTKYLESSPGNKSNSRRIAWAAFWVGCTFAFMILSTGLYDYVTAPYANKPSLMGIAGAAGTIFGSIAGSAMAYVFFSKTQEKPKQNETI